MRQPQPPLSAQQQDRLRTEIGRLGLKALAERTGVSPGTLTRLAAGVGAFRATRAAVERALDLPTL